MQLRMWLLLGAAACGGNTAPEDVTWVDLVGPESVDWTWRSLFQFRVAVDTPERMFEAVHPTGSVLEVGLYGVPDGATVTSLQSEIASVLSVRETASVDTGIAAGSGAEIQVDLAFHQAGTTELFVVDGEGAVLDFQPIEVRDAATYVIAAYDELTYGEPSELSSADVVSGTALTFALGWVSADQHAMSGSGILEATPTSDAVEAVPTSGLEGRGFESFDVIVPTAAPAGPTAIEIAIDPETSALVSTGPLGSFPVVVHAPEEVSEVVLQSDTAGGRTLGGTIFGVGYAGTTRLTGVPLKWTVDGDAVGTGTWIRWQTEGTGRLKTVKACFDGVCASEEIAGDVTEVHGAQQGSDALLCGCAAVPSRWTAPWALGVVWLVRRRHVGGRKGS